MGAFTSRRNAGVEEVDISTGNAYRFPPKSGCYFGSHFFMGGERFETTQPESYLFGENQDLNFLGNRPIPFPYPAPQAHEPTKTLKSLVNIRKDSLRLIKVVDSEVNVSHKEKALTGEDVETEDLHKYNIEFTFDSDVKCAITIYYFANEEISNKQALYHSRDASLNSETFHYKRGANQVFNQTTHILDPSTFSEEEWQYNPDKEMVPIVIQCVVEEEDNLGHSHMTFAVLEKGSDSHYSIKPLKQKQMVDGLCYLLQEIYGIENKTSEIAKDEDVDDNGCECAICLTETRDTLILPCRHLCLCNGCADSLRYQASNCPICRAPFRALLQIRAMRKKLNPSSPQQLTPSEGDMGPTLSQEGVPPGFEAVSLIDALNGPSTSPPVSTTAAPAPHNYPDGENPELDKLLANESGDDSTRKKKSHRGSSRRGGVEPSQGTPTSPEESPLIDRKINRKASTGSNKSRSSLRKTKLPACDQTESMRGHSPGGSTQSLERVGTPDVAVTDMGAEVNKSPGSSKKFSMPRIRYPEAKTMLNGPPGDRSSDNIKDADETDIDIVTGADSRKSMGTNTPPPDYDAIDEDSTDYEQLKPCSDVIYEQVRPAAAHATVVYDEQEVAKEGMDVPHSQKGTHSLLPGTLAASPDVSGSSYSSTESGKGLLVSHKPDNNKPLMSEAQPAV